jgi:hypothetical protein
MFDAMSMDSIATAMPNPTKRIQATKITNDIVLNPDRFVGALFVNRLCL